MTDNDVPVTAQTEGGVNTADVDTSSLTINAKTVHRQRIQLAGDSANDLAQVTNSQVLTNANGLIVREVNSDIIRRLKEIGFLQTLQQYEWDNTYVTKDSLNNMRGTR